MDLDSDGVLSPSEVRDAVQRYGMTVSDEDLDEMIRSVDRDSDGMVGIEEFSSALRPRRRSSVTSFTPDPEVMRATLRRSSQLILPSSEQLSVLAGLEEEDS